MSEQGEQRHRGDRELDRIVFFSDAVFAIALTLLVLDIKVPEIPDDLVADELPAQLLALWPKYFGYVLSFVVIISFWNIHHSIFSGISGYDRGIIWLNTIFLMFVAFVPLPSLQVMETKAVYLDPSVFDVLCHVNSPPSPRLTSEQIEGYWLVNYPLAPVRPARRLRPRSRTFSDLSPPGGSLAPRRRYA